MSDRVGEWVSEWVSECAGAIAFGFDFTCGNSEVERRFGLRGKRRWGECVCVFEVRACLCPHPGGGSMFKVEVVLLDVKEGTRSRRQPH